MPKLKQGTILPDDAEDTAITAAAMSDPDAVPLTDEQWEAVMPHVNVGGRPRLSIHKVPTTIRFDPDVLDGLRATGKGWQTRLNQMVREWLSTHPAKQ